MPDGPITFFNRGGDALYSGPEIAVGCVELVTCKECADGALTVDDTLGECGNVGTRRFNAVRGGVVFE